MEYPTSIYPQSKPLEAGFYLVHDSIIKKWIVARWSKKYNDWEGRPSVDMFIPFRLAYQGEYNEKTACIP